MLTSKYLLISAQLHSHLQSDQLSFINFFYNKDSKNDLN